MLKIKTRTINVIALFISVNNKRNLGHTITVAVSTGNYLNRQHFFYYLLKINREKQQKKKTTSQKCLFPIEAWIIMMKHLGQWFYSRKKSSKFLLIQESKTYGKIIKAIIQTKVWLTCVYTCVVRNRNVKNVFTKTPEPILDVNKNNFRI